MFRLRLASLPAQYHLTDRFLRLLGAAGHVIAVGDGEFVQTAFRAMVLPAAKGRLDKCTTIVPDCAYSRYSADRITDLVMDVTDRLYELYVAEFEEFASRARRIAHECASPNPDKLWARQFSPQEFRAYLSEASRQSEAKRWFVRRLLRGNEELQSELPSHLVALLDETVIRPPHFLGLQQRSLR